MKTDLEREGAPDANDDGLLGEVDSHKKGRLAHVDVVVDVEQRAVGEVDHLGVGGQVAAAAVVVQDGGLLGQEGERQGALSAARGQAETPETKNIVSYDIILNSSL